MEYQTEDLQTMIIIDLSFIRFNLYAGVSKYAYRLLDYIVEEGKSDDYILLLNIVSENKIREWYPQFKTISIERYIYLMTFVEKSIRVAAKLCFVLGAMRLLV